MNMNRRAFLLIVLGATVLLPFGFLYAAGIIPCQGDACQLCSVIQLGQNVINFLMVLGVAVGVLMISIGGIQLVLSQGNESAKEKAKSRVWNVVIGFVIILTAYLIVNTVLTALTGKSLQGWAVSCVGGNELSSKTNMSKQKTSGVDVVTSPSAGAPR